VELFLIDSLGQLIEQERDGAETDTESLIASANLISRVSEMVERAEPLFQDRDYQRARELYLSAVAEIPAVKLGYDRLREIEGLFAERRNQEVAGLMAGAGSAYRRGDYETAVNGYARALTLLQGRRGTVDEMIAQIMEAGYQLRPAEVAATEAEGKTGDAGVPGELERLGAELEAARNRIVELEAAQGEARERLTELEAARRRITELDNARSGAERRVAELEAAVQRLTANEATQADLARLTGDLEAARGRIRELESARNVAQQRIDELEVAAAEVRRRTAELEAARRRIVELERAKAQAEQRVEELESARRAAQQRIGELETAAAEAQRRAAELEAARSRIAELEAAGKVAEGRLAELEAEQRQRQAAASELQRIRRQYLALTARGDAGAHGASSALITLLETKVLIQRVLISEPVRSQYPELYDRFELYLEALVEEQERDTQVVVLRDVETLLDSLIREQGRKVPVNTLQLYRTESASQPFLQVLDKLELLLQ
jgi:chromosome segregation ATPase